MKLVGILISPESGNMLVRWMKPAIGDKGPEPHLGVFPCGCDVEAEFRKVQADRAAYGNTVQDDDLSELQAYAAVAWKPHLVEAAAVAAQLAREEADREQALKLERQQLYTAEMAATRKAELEAAVAAVLAGK